MARNTYYANNYAPHFFIDGNIDGEANRGTWGSMIENESLVDAELVMSLSGYYMADSAAGYVTVTIFVESSPGLNNYKLRLALTEDGITWRAPNGATLHDQTFRDMIPSTSGQAVTLVVGDTLEYTFRFTTRSPEVVDNLNIIAFVQADQNKHIVQSTKIGVAALLPNGIDDGVDMPEAYSLAQNYPNPFNAGTRIDFVSNGGHTNLEVFDVTGARVATLVDGSTDAGRQSVTWDGRDAQGNPVSSGTYFYRLRSDSGNEIKRMTLLK